SQIEVPLPGKLRGGVMAITVSSKALEATTMVVQSDLDVIVKSSRDEVFVFAENMLTGKPWAGVRLLVSNDHEVIGEGTTDAHGVYQKNYKDLTAGRIDISDGTATAREMPAGGPLPSTVPAPPNTTLPSPPTPPAPPDIRP